MADTHISPGFLTPSAAEYLQRAARQAEQSRQTLAESVPVADEKDFPAVITSGSGGYHAWTEQAFDENGDRYTKPGGRTGTAASNPACNPARKPMDYPVEVWLRRTIWNATYGLIYETVGGKGNPETAAVTITSSTPIASRYQAVRRIQTGLPSAWPTAEQVWVYNTQSSSLYAGLTLANARYNTDQYLGLDQLAVDYCCGITSSCDCSVPALACVTVDAPDSCFDGLVTIARNNGFAGSIQTDLLYYNNDPLNLPLTFSAAVTCIGTQWVGVISGNGGSKSPPLCWGSDYDSQSVEVTCGPPWTAVITGTHHYSGQPITITFTEIATEEECPVSGGSGGSSCITSLCGPPSIPSSILMTWAITSTDGSCVGTDGEEEILPYSHTTGDSYWILGGSLSGKSFAGEEFFLYFQCGISGAAGYTLYLNFVVGGPIFYGTFTETSPGVWTLLIPNITLPTDDGCVYQLSGTFDEADCA